MNYASGMDPYDLPEFDEEPDESTVATRVLVVAITLVLGVALVILACALW